MVLSARSGWMDFRDTLNGFITGEHLDKEGISLPPLMPATTEPAASTSSGLQLWVENVRVQKSVWRGGTSAVGL